MIIIFSPGLSWSFPPFMIITMIFSPGIISWSFPPCIIITMIFSPGLSWSFPPCIIINNDLLPRHSFSNPSPTRPSSSRWVILKIPLVFFTQKISMLWNVLKCFEMLCNALKCFKVMVSKPTRSFFTSSQGSVDHGSRFPTYYHGGRTQEANEKDAWTGSLIFIVYLSKFQHPKYCKLLTIIKKCNFRIPVEVFGLSLRLLSFEYFMNRM